LFFFEKSGRCDFGAEVAGGNTHDVLQCSSASADTACYCLVTGTCDVRLGDNWILHPAIAARKNNLAEQQQGLVTVWLKLCSFKITAGRVLAELGV
jgi:hypothetical protein